MEERPAAADAADDEATGRDVRDGKTNSAIRSYCNVTSASLLDAKAHVESLARNDGAILPSSGPRLYVIVIAAIVAIVFALRYFYVTGGVAHVPY